MSPETYHLKKHLLCSSAFRRVEVEQPPPPPPIQPLLLDFTDLEETTWEYRRVLESSETETSGTSKELNMTV